MIDILIYYLAIGLVIAGITVFFKVNKVTENEPKTLDGTLDDLMLELDRDFGKQPKSLRYTLTLFTIIMLIILWPIKAFDILIGIGFGIIGKKKR